MKDSTSIKFAKENSKSVAALFFFIIVLFQKHCFSTQTYNSIQLFHFAVFEFQDHLGKCQKVAVACPNCNKKMLREKVFTPLRNTGCPEKIQYKNSIQ